MSLVWGRGGGEGCEEGGGAVACGRARGPGAPENDVRHRQRRGVGDAARADGGDCVVAARERGLEKDLPRGERVREGGVRGHVIGRADGLRAWPRAPPVAKGLQRRVVRCINRVKRRTVRRHSDLYGRGGRVEVAVNRGRSGRALEDHVAAEARVEAIEKCGRGRWGRAADRHGRHQQRPRAGHQER